MTELMVGDVIEGVVSDRASEGEGIIKLDGYPVFIPYCIKGERVRAKIAYVKKDWATGELLEVLEASERRVKPRCPYFGKCGGCDLQHMCVSEQLDVKREAVKNALRKIGGIDVDVPLPVRAEEWGYRNKLALPFYQNKHSGRVYLGFYEKRSHKVVPIKWCPLNGEWAADVISCVTEWANAKKLSAYDELTDKGLLRHVVARKLSSLAITLVINADDAPYLDELYASLSEKFEDVCLYVSVNKRRGNVIFGDSVRLARGRAVPQKLGMFETEVSPISFLQVNDNIRDRLYDYAAELLDGFDGEIVELYSGVGLLTAQLALRLEGSRFLSVEIEKCAADDAARLMKKLNISDRVDVRCADALEYARFMEASNSALILDPPRRGIDRRIAEAVDRTNFAKVIYISCDPQTLARDIALLKTYAVDSVATFDMFPQTSNVETVVCLKKA